MSLLPWGTIANLEQSLVDFLVSEITTDLITVLNNKGQEVAPMVRVGKKFDNNWTLPVIQIYQDSVTSDRATVGSNRRDDRWLVIMDIRAENETQRVNLASWLKDTINEGCPYYEYFYAALTPTRNQNGNISLDFISNNAVNLGDDVSIYDKYRHRISISVWIAKPQS